MIQNFNGIFYLLVFIVHFVAYGVYAYKCVIGTKSFLKHEQTQSLFKHNTLQKQQFKNRKNESAE